MDHSVWNRITTSKAQFVLYLVLIILPASYCTTTSSVCYGTPGISCTTHKLYCPSQQVIQIINTSYGYRPGCNEYRGLSSCDNTTCCNEESGDCFIPFYSEEDQQVARNCNGIETCELRGFRRYNYTDTVCNGSEVSAYSKIQFDCVSSGISTIVTTRRQTTQKSTQITQFDTSAQQVSTSLPESTFSTSISSKCSPCPVPSGDSSGTVGGVLGTLLIVSVIINVGLIVYFTRFRKSSTSTPRDITYDGINNTGRDQPLNTYDGITNTGRNQPPNTYDALQTQSTGNFDKGIKKSNSNHTYYNTKDDCLSQSNDQYYENLKKQ